MTEKKETILKVALELFAKEGYNAVSTGMIAKQAGVSDGLVFRHFGNKEGLLKAVLEHGAELAQKHFASIVFEADPKAVLKKALELATQINKAEYPYWRLLYALKWQQGSYDDSISAPLKNALTTAFQKLGYNFPKVEADLFMVYFDGLATHILLHEETNVKEIIHLLKTKYQV